MKLKALMLAFAATLSMVFFAACGDDAKEATKEAVKEAVEPKDVAIACLKALENCDYDTAAKYMSKDSKFRSMLSYSAEEKKGLAEEIKSEYAGVKWGKTEIVGDEAHVHYILNLGGSEHPRKFIMKKENGNWKLFDDVSAGRR